MILPVCCPRHNADIRKRLGPYGPSLFASCEGGEFGLDADHTHADQHQGCDAKCGHNAHANLLALGQSVAAVLAGLGVYEEAGDVAHAGEQQERPAVVQTADHLEGQGDHADGDLSRVLVLLGGELDLV